ncbi:gamma-glutamyltransferase [Phenylobacterium sp.]|uniref:gamma-glutamyltransferase n=1 Tax=Phenylobacterium sp. TaxID=1871053 RepID=UPI002C6765C4|nr:gamma-glutamyltransferase [Phenylobacterium sp.]HLZ73874.1 gamma-glutamyltransferase [Phenylobacterium sp.]
MTSVRCWAAVAAVLAGLAPAQAADLSPARWPAQDRDRLQARQLAIMPAATREFAGGSALVAGMTSPIAVHAGKVALDQGGSAADAAAVAALTEIATTKGMTVSFAGKFELAYYEAKSGKVTFLDGSWAPYALETDPKSVPEADLRWLRPGSPAPDAKTAAWGRQTMTPGFMAGLGAMHARYGRLPWASLFQPAIWYAENGIVVPAGMVNFFRQYRPLFSATADGRRFAGLDEEGPPKRGDLMRQPDLAVTLRNVAANGPSEMYQGAWAKAYVAAVDAAGGRATLGDLKRYRPVWREPIRTEFAGATVYGMEGGSLSCASLGALNLLQAMGAPGLGPYWRDPKAFKAYARAIRYATIRQYYPDTSSSPLELAKGFPAPGCGARVTPAYAAAIAPELLKNNGDPFAAPVAASGEGHHTMSVVTVDRWGDVAVLVHSSNGGPTGLVVGGVSIPNAASINKALLATTKSGELLRNDIAPLIALRRGKPVLAIGATASSLMPETVRLAGELLSGHADLPAALSAPPLLQNFNLATPGQTLWSRPELIPAAGPDPSLARALASLGAPTPDLPPAAYDPAMIAALAAMGVPTTQEPAIRVFGDLRGSATVVAFDRPSGTPRAAEVPLTDVFVEADGPRDGQPPRRARRAP